MYENGYYGIVGIDVLENDRGERFLVDLNPRLTGVTPFLFVCRQWVRAGRFPAALYIASARFSGGMTERFQAIESESARFVPDAQVVVYSAVESPEPLSTTCHLSIHADTFSTCQRLQQRLGLGGQ